MIRICAVIIAAFAILLAPVPGHRAYAAVMVPAMEAAACAHHVAEGNASVMTKHAEAGQHTGNHCKTDVCCLGAVCMFTGVLPTAVVTVPSLAVAADLSGLSALLTGRDVAPPLDPPKLFV